MALAKRSPVPAAKPAAGVSLRGQDRLPGPAFTAGHKALVQFKSDLRMQTLGFTDVTITVTPT